LEVFNNDFPSSWAVSTNLGRSFTEENFGDSSSLEEGEKDSGCFSVLGAKIMGSGEK